MTIRTLDDIRVKKESINSKLKTNEAEIAESWRGLFHAQRPSNRGEMFAQIISNSLTVYDGFMLVRRLMGRSSRRRSKWLF
ncbi:MAG: hypothetical protein Q4F34_06485 [Prevotellaceae bacterium]|nr:hypothetical protein [Prevotellaceae bacterium]